MRLCDITPILISVLDYSVIRCIMNSRRVRVTRTRTRHTAAFCPFTGEERRGEEEILKKRIPQFDEIPRMNVRDSPESRLAPVDRLIHRLLIRLTTGTADCDLVSAERKRRNR